MFVWLSSTAIENLVIAKKERAIIRDSINNFINKIDTFLNDADTNILDLEKPFGQLNKTSVELKKSESKIEKLVQEAHIEAELQSANEAEENITSWRFTAKRKIKELS